MKDETTETTERTWALSACGGGDPLKIEVEDEADAILEAGDWVRDWAGDAVETQWIDVQIRRPDGSRTETTVVVEPEEPPCDDDAVDHDWRELGVSGHGGGVLCSERCETCGLRRSTDTWATRPDTGEEGLRSTRYETADDVRA